jgi:hypothetical protein
MRLGPSELITSSASGLAVYFGRFVVFCPSHQVPEININNANRCRHFVIFLLVIKDLNKPTSFCTGFVKGLVKEG